MCTEKSDSMIQKALKSLCCNNGWSYGVFWRFDRRNSLLLTMEDAYYEEQMGVVIDNMLLEVHMLGSGIIGEAAFTRKHRWMFSDAHSREQNPVGCIDIQDIFQDDSEFHPQFSLGIQTIAVISVEPKGVVQFGSTQKIPERMEVVDQTKRLFREMESGDGLSLLEIAPSSSSNSDICGPNRLFASLMSSQNSYFGNLKPVHDISSTNFIGTACSFTNLTQLSPFTSDHGKMIRNSSHLGNQLQMACAEALVDHSAEQNPGTIIYCDGFSTLTSFKQQLPSEMRVQGSQDVFPAANLNNLVSCSNTVQISPNSQSCILDNISRSPEHSNNTLDNDLSQAMRVTSVSSSLNGAGVHNNIPVNHPANSMQSSITTTFTSDGTEKCCNISGVENDLFEGLGVDFGCCGQAGDPFDGHLDTSECILEQHVSSMVGPQKGLFSKLGIEQLLDDISSFEDVLSSPTKRRRTGSSSVSSAQVQSAGLPNCFGGTMNLLQPVYDLEPKKESIPKSEVDSWYSMNCRSTVVSQPKREEPGKVTKKKARPGARPRPRDRQQIQERIQELRDLIPNGVKMSIDSLLARTIKHVLFLQSVTKHADKLKQIDEPKENGLFMKENSSSSGSGSGVTWAYELGAQTMVCPLVVEDLSSPGQMLIEMLCEEQGFFLEIVDIIRGFGLTILKGVMEARENKIWARFIVEAEASRNVARVEIFMALVPLLEPTATNVNGQLDGVGGATLFNNYQQPLAPLPVSLADIRS